MIWYKNKLKTFGYHSFKPLTVQTEPIQIREVALKNDVPFVAVAQKKGKKGTLNAFSSDSIPSSIQFVMVEGTPQGLYRRNRDDLFVKSYPLPKADGAQWGTHAKEDLIPIKNIRQMVRQIQKGLDRVYYEALAYILAFKIGDELGEDAISFKSRGDIQDSQAMLKQMALTLNLEKEWHAMKAPFSDQLNEAVMNIQPFRLVDEIQTGGIIGIVNDLISANNDQTTLSIPNPINTVANALLADKGEPIYIAGQSAINLLDLAIIHKHSMRYIGDCHPLIEFLGQRCIRDFAIINEESMLSKTDTAGPVIIGVPPYGRKTKDDKGSKRINSELFWLQEQYHLLQDNGWLIGFLTEGFLSNASLRYARQWVMDHFRIDAVISLPASFFRPGSGIKTNLVCLHKTSSLSDDYPVFMAEIENLYADDMPALAASYRAFKQRAAE